MSASSRKRDHTAVAIDTAAKMKPSLDAIERSRLAWVKRIKTGTNYLFGGGACIVVLLIIATRYNYVAFVIIPVVIYCVVIYMKYLSGHKSNYRTLYKNVVIKEITQSLQPEMNYSPSRGISLDLFRAMRLYTSGVDSYQAEDLFEGKIGKTKMTFSEALAREKRTSTDSKGRTRTRWVTIFRGTLVTVDFNKHFSSWLTVQPDFAEKNLGWFGRKLQGISSKLIRLENPEFEKQFVVHGSDQVEARYILTPEMQERLLQLRRNFCSEIRMSFLNSSFNIAIPNSHNLFEPDIYKSAYDSAEILKFIRQMTSLFQIVEDLDLNTRIWTKN